MIEILDPATDATRIAALLDPGSGFSLTDAWDTAARELAAIDPTGPRGTPRYVVYDWRARIVKLPDSETFWRLRTARNRYLLDDQEQRRWSNARIGIAGLSVGASALSVCALTGARRFRLAEHDTLGLTNLNRLPASVCDIGVPKLTIAQRRVFETDPYSSVTVFPDGYTPDIAPAFLGDADEPLTVLIEEMDDLAAKVDIRRRARDAGIPVVMATDNGDNAILDVERFDLDPGYPLFHGRAGDLTDLTTSTLDDPRDRAAIAQRIVGADITPRTRFSLTQVGRSLPSWPQLGTAATLAGAVAAYAARLIATGHPLPSGRYRLDMDRALLGAAADTADQWNELTEAQFLAAVSAMGGDPRSA
ncbi:ThiF family adenylyltransferase [Nocardia sp. NPDC051052]|uniref:ThiF family adenylyltransferase n=1 Tax=Nocardia sp. NPDC051052 TaxID=3364322 RepID=UPI0037BA47B6